MAQTTSWNLTVPDTSPLIQYESFAQSCPNIVKGQALCGDGTSAHISNDTDATVTINFYGNAIYLFGNVTQGTLYTTTLDGDTSQNLKPDGDLLAKYENLKNQASDDQLHVLTLDAKQFTQGSTLAFTKAIISVDTGLVGAIPSVTTYNYTNPDLVFTPGWVVNSTYKASGSQFDQQVSLSFNGSAVWITGMCDTNLGSFFDGAYGNVYVDSNVNSGDPISLQDSSDNVGDTPFWVVPHCLLYWNTGLEEGPHNITLDTQENNVFISSMQVLSVSGGNAGGNNSGDGGNDGGGGFSGSNGGSSSSDPSAGPSTDGSILAHINVPLVVGIIATVAAVLIVAGVVLMMRRSRRRRRTSAMMVPRPPMTYNNGASGVGVGPTGHSANYAFNMSSGPTTATYPPQPPSSYPPSATPYPSTAPYGPPPLVPVESHYPPPPGRPPIAPLSIPSRRPSADPFGTPSSRRAASADPFATPARTPSAASSSTHHTHGGRMVLSAEGTTYEDLPGKLAAEMRTESRRPAQTADDSVRMTGSSSSRPAEDDIPDMPPPRYEL